MRKSQTKKENKNENMMGRQGGGSNKREGTKAEARPGEGLISEHRRSNSTPDSSELDV